MRRRTEILHQDDGVCLQHPVPNQPRTVVLLSPTNPILRKQASIMEEEQRLRTEWDAIMKSQRRDGIMDGRLLPWLQRAGALWTTSTVPSLCLQQLLRVALEAVLRYCEDTGTLPPEVGRWLQGFLVPMKVEDCDLAAIIVQILTYMTKKNADNETI